MTQKTNILIDHLCVYPKTTSIAIGLSDKTRSRHHDHWWASVEILTKWLMSQRNSTGRKNIQIHKYVHQFKNMDTDLKQRDSKILYLSSLKYCLIEQKWTITRQILSDSPEPYIYTGPITHRQAKEVNINAFYRRLLVWLSQISHYVSVMTNDRHSEGKIQAD